MRGLKCCVTLLTFFSLSQSKLVYNEDVSVSLIEAVDRPRRSIFEEFDEAQGFEHHGHSGDEDVASSSPRFTNEWVVEITGGVDGARVLAEEMGYEIIGQV